MTSERFWVDSNVLAYAYDERDPKNVAALDVLEDAFKDGRGVIGAQNLAEFCRVALEKNVPPMPAERLARIVRALAHSVDIATYSSDALIVAVELKRDCGLHFFDALLAATMREHHISTIVTEDERDFKKIPGLKVVNPFKPKHA